MDIPHHQIIRRIIRDLHFRIAACFERACAGDIVPFEDDIPELRGDIAHEEIMRHLRVGQAVEEVVLLAVLHDLAAFDFIAIGIVELAALLGAFLSEELIRQIDLGIEFLVIANADILRCLLLLFLLRQCSLLFADVRLVVLLGVGRDAIAVGTVVAADRTGVCRFCIGLRGIGSGLIQISHLRRSLCLIVCLLRSRICYDPLLVRIRRHVFFQRLSGICRQCFDRRPATLQRCLCRFFCALGGSERTLSIDCRCGRTVIRVLALCDGIQPIDLILRLFDFFLIGILDLRQERIRLIPHCLRTVQLRGA